MMKKRNLIIAAAVTTVIGSGIAFAGAKHCGGADGHGQGHYGKHKIEHIMERLDKHLDLTDQQELSLQSILEDNKMVFMDARHDKKSFRLAVMQLDPSSSEYDASIASLADEIAEQARQRTLQAADIVKQVSTVLTDEQMQKARELIEKRMKKHERHEVNGEVDGNADS